MNVGPDSGRVIVITGAMAAGKSTVAQLLAQRLPRSVHVRGDVFRRMIVGGREDMAPEPSPAARQQLRLRYDLAAASADAYARAGFEVVVQDVILGAELPLFLDRIRCPRRHLVVLAPNAATLAQREASRPKNGYGAFSPAELDAGLRATTPAIGYWLDSSGQTPSQTVQEILAHLEEARV